MGILNSNRTRQRGSGVIDRGKLLILPQMRDRRAVASDDTADHFWPSVSYHLSLMFLAFSAWFWSRTVLQPVSKSRIETKIAKQCSASGRMSPPSIFSHVASFSLWLSAEYLPPPRVRIGPMRSSFSSGQRLVTSHCGSDSIFKSAFGPHQLREDEEVRRSVPTT